MRELYPILIQEKINLAHPFSIFFTWDDSPVDGITEHYQTAIKAFKTHLLAGAFLPMKEDASTFSKSSVEVILKTINEKKFEIEFSHFPYQTQGLRILIRALQYFHCRSNSHVQVVLAGEKFDKSTNGSLFAVDELELPLRERTVSFNVARLWCYKNIRIFLEFATTFDDAIVEPLDNIVANWVILANLGGYATKEQVENFSEDEEIGLFLDIPSVGDDFCEWNLTQLNVSSECVITLINMLQAFLWKEIWPTNVEIS